METTQETKIEIGKNHVLFTAIKTIADIQRMKTCYRSKNKLIESLTFANYIKVENGGLYFVSPYSIVWTDDPAIVKNWIQDGIYMINKNTKSLVQITKVSNDIVIYPNFKRIIDDNIKFDADDDKVDNYYLSNHKGVLNPFIGKIYNSLVNEGNERKIAVDIKHVELFIKNLYENNVSFAHKKNSHIFYIECIDKHLYSIFCGYLIKNK